MQTVDVLLIALYLAVLLGLGLSRRLRSGSTASDLVVGGRTLTLPGFVASLVSTWYGGILGVGEFSYQHGLSNWLVFGVPYYLAAAIFAVFLAARARETRLLTIPERLAQVYDDRTALAGSIVIYLMTIPAAYVLMLGVLAQQLFGWSFAAGVVGGTLFSIVYVFTGGFRSVVRTDVFQFILMFVGFAVLLTTVAGRYGGLDFLTAQLPPELLTWHGGNSRWYIATWYVIALATLIEPAFYQRCYAARTAQTARRGIFISILFWGVFDFMTTACGLYARALLPDLADPVSSYPALGRTVLPAGLLGLFMLSLLATVMSTVDSYSFLAASTFGNDIMPRLAPHGRRSVTWYTRAGLVLSAGLAVVLAMYFRSVVDIWHIFGSVGVPALLVPVFTSFTGRRRMPPRAAFWCMAAAGTVALAWYVSGLLHPDGRYWGNIEPIFPGLAVSLAVFFLTARRHTGALPQS